ncbi:MAG: glycosyltransferase, partial [Anaerolineales bacterium]
METFPARRLLDPVRFVRLVNFLRRERFDVLHTHLAYANLLGVLAGQFAGVPVVSTLHNVQVEQRRTHPLRDQLETWALCYGARRVFAVGYV